MEGTLKLFYTEGWCWIMFNIAHQVSYVWKCEMGLPKNCNSAGTKDETKMESNLQKGRRPLHSRFFLDAVSICFLPTFSQAFHPRFRKLDLFKWLSWKKGAAGDIYNVHISWFHGIWLGINLYIYIYKRHDVQYIMSIQSIYYDNPMSTCPMGINGYKWDMMTWY